MHLGLTARDFVCAFCLQGRVVGSSLPLSCFPVCLCLRLLVCNLNLTAFALNSERQLEVGVMVISDVPSLCFVFEVFSGMCRPKSWGRSYQRSVSYSPRQVRPCAFPWSLKLTPFIHWESNCATSSSLHSPGHQR